MSIIKRNFACPQCNHYWHPKVLYRGQTAIFDRDIGRYQLLECDEWYAICPKCDYDLGLTELGARFAVNDGSGELNYR